MRYVHQLSNSSFYGRVNERRHDSMIQHLGRSVPRVQTPLSWAPSANPIHATGYIHIKEDRRVALMKIRTNQLMHSKQESSQPWSKGHSLGGQG